MTSAPTLRHYVGGERLAVEPKFDSINPSNTNDVVAQSPDDDGAVTSAAVAAAVKAFPSWANATPETRSDVLDRVGVLIFERKDELSRLLAREEGKTLPESAGEVARAARIFRFFAGEALRRTGTTVDSTRAGVDAATYREPVGVFGLIAPWNFPIAIPAWKSAPALAFGNTVVLKPSELTPALASALADIVHDAGAPKGVFNVVFGAGNTGRALVEHPDVAGVSFTGSQNTGARIAQAAAARQARIQLEMGGKNALVVLDDADLERAVQCALDGAFFATGQRCTASSRLIVTNAIYEDFVRLLGENVAALRVGDALDPAAQIGPLASAQQLDRIALLPGGCEAGRRAPARGRRRAAACESRLLLSPDAARRHAHRYACEQRGDLRSGRFRRPRQRLRRGACRRQRRNFGLSAGIVTSSFKYARHFTRNVRAGMVMVNLPTAGVDYHVPFGGSRRSSYGPREQGAAAVEFYTQIKTAYTWA